MARYKVTFQVTRLATAIVDAEDEDEARETAAEMADEDYDWSDSDWETWDVAPVEHENANRVLHPDASYAKRKARYLASTDETEQPDSPLGEK